MRRDRWRVFEWAIRSYFVSGSWAGCVETLTGSVAGFSTDIVAGWSMGLQFESVYLTFENSGTTIAPASIDIPIGKSNHAEIENLSFGVA